VQVKLVHLVPETENSSQRETPVLLEVVQIDHTVPYTQKCSQSNI